MATAMPRRIGPTMSRMAGTGIITMATIIATIATVMAAVAGMVMTVMTTARRAIAPAANRVPKAGHTAATTQGRIGGAARAGRVPDRSGRAVIEATGDAEQDR